MDKLTEQALALPAEARAMLADRLAESLDPLLEEPFRTLWAAEALRRRDEVRASQVKTIPAKTALAKIRKSIHE